MITILKNLICYGPRPLGRCDVLLCGGVIEKIDPFVSPDGADCIMDCDGDLAFPGIIDQHMHLLGGGGEDGFGGRLPEVPFDSIIESGITTVVGLLGADSCCRSLDTLFARAGELEAKGLTTYLYTGSYRVPIPTFTGDLLRDLVLIHKVIGVGEIAISDHRSSHPTREELVRICSETHMGALLGGKAGVVHLHIGDGKEGLAPLFDLLLRSDVPPGQLVPSHVNRNSDLFESAIRYYGFGGNIDLTAGEEKGLTVLEALMHLTEEGVPLSRVTVSSDAGGSAPGGTCGRAESLFRDIVDCIRGGIAPEVAFALVTEQVARLLHLYPRKGTLLPGSDADLLITDKEYRIKMLFANGIPLVGILQ